MQSYSSPQPFSLWEEIEIGIECRPSPPTSCGWDEMRFSISMACTRWIFSFWFISTSFFCIFLKTTKEAGLPSASTSGKSIHNAKKMATGSGDDLIIISLASSGCIVLFLAVVIALICVRRRRIASKVNHGLYSRCQPSQPYFYHNGVFVFVTEIAAKNVVGNVSVKWLNPAV